MDSKDAAINYLVDLHARVGNITDKAVFKEGIVKGKRAVPPPSAKALPFPMRKIKL